MITLSRVAVVIPIYKEELDDFEKISLAQVRKILKNYPIVFVAPEDKNFPYIKPGEMLIQFHPYFFQHVMTYNQLLLQPFFYELFLNFDYILIYQLDAFVFYDALEEFCQLGYDYIGAPVAYHSWYGYKQNNKVPRVGNGGFSLRKVKTCHQLLTECQVLSKGSFVALNKFKEDAFFGVCGIFSGLNFNTAPIEVALRFAVDYFPDRFLRRVGNKIPFGCHGWSKYSADAYVKLFAQAGYDLRPFRDKMDNQDYQYALKASLIIVAFYRLIYRVHPDQYILKFLPTKKFASVRVIRSTDTMKILTQLLTEKNSLADKIFIYDENDLQSLIKDLTRETLPHLIIALKYDDTPFLEEIEGKGFTYGKHFILFQHEHMKFQEKLFHNLGR